LKFVENYFRDLHRKGDANQQKVTEKKIDLTGRVLHICIEQGPTHFVNLALMLIKICIIHIMILVIIVIINLIMECNVDIEVEFVCLFVCLSVRMSFLPMSKTLPPYPHFHSADLAGE